MAVLDRYEGMLLDCYLRSESGYNTAAGSSQVLKTMKFIHFYAHTHTNM